MELYIITFSNNSYLLYCLQAIKQLNFVLYKTSVDVEIAYLFINFSEFLQKAMNNYYCRSYETTEVWDHCRNSF